MRELFISSLLIVIKKQVLSKGFLNLGLVFLLSVLIFQAAFYVFQKVPPVFPYFDHLIFGLLFTSLAIALILSAYKYLEKIKKFPKVFQREDFKAFGTAVLIYLIPAVIGLFVASIAGLITLEFNLNMPGIIVNLFAVMVLVLLSEAIPEELIFRGYIYNKLSEIFKSNWFVIILQAVLFFIFAFLIGAIDSVLDGSFLFTFAMILGMCRNALGSMWASVGFHFAIMTMQQSLNVGWDAVNVDPIPLTQTYILGIFPMTFSFIYLYLKMSNQN